MCPVRESCPWAVRQLRKVSAEGSFEAGALKPVRFSPVCRRFRVVSVTDRELSAMPVQRSACLRGRL